MNGITIGIIGIIVTILITAIPFIYKRFRAPIKIFPKQVSIKAKNWKVKTTFHIQNTTTKILFDVWIKLILEDCDIKSADISINSGVGEGHLIGRMSNISINYDFVRINGTDEAGRSCIFFILQSLVPGIPQPLTIEDTSELNVSNSRNSRILLKAVRYSKEPVRLLSNNKGVAYPIKPPEKFLLKSLSFLIKRER